MKDLFIVIGGVATFFGVIIGFLALDASGSTYIDRPAIVVSKQYTPARSETGIGTGISSQGKPVVVTTTSSSSEKFTLIVETVNGETFGIDTNGPYWNKVALGEAVTVEESTTRWLGVVMRRIK